MHSSSSHDCTIILNANPDIASIHIDEEAHCTTMRVTKKKRRVSKMTTMIICTNLGIFAYITLLYHPPRGDNNYLKWMMVVVVIVEVSVVLSAMISLLHLHPLPHQ
jgi:hypothetical protein